MSDTIKKILKEYVPYVVVIILVFREFMVGENEYKIIMNYRIKS